MSWDQSWNHDSHGRALVLPLKRNAAHIKALIKAALTAPDDCWRQYADGAGRCAQVLAHDWRIRW